MNQESQYSVSAQRQQVDRVQLMQCNHKLRNMQGMKEYTSCSISRCVGRILWTGLICIAPQNKFDVLKHAHHFLKVTSKLEQSSQKTITYHVHWVELQSVLDSLSRLRYVPKCDESLGLAEVTLGPRLFELDHGLSICERRNKFAVFKIGGRAVGEDGRKFLAHDLLGLPRRALACETRCLTVATDSFLPLVCSEKGLAHT